MTDERNALVLDDVIDLFAHEGAVRAFDRQRLVVTLGLVSLSL